MRAAGLALLLAPWIAGLALKDHAWTASKGEPLKVAAVQGNVEQNMKWDPAQLEAQLNLYRDMTLSSRPADLIVWPETAVPVLREYAEGYLNVMGRVAAERDAALITGVPVRQRNVSMVYQQFINYPGLTVYENIASPLRILRRPCRESPEGRPRRRQRGRQSGDREGQHHDERHG